MKGGQKTVKLRYILLTFVLVLAALPVYSQEQSETPNYFAKTFFIHKIYPHKEGYKVIYMQRGFDTKSTYVPMTWFQGTNSKAEMIYDEHASLPYMEVYWEDNQFSHVRLFVHRDINHPSWGALAFPEQLNGTFTMETLELN